jgi:hypothetical protein
LPLLLLGGKRTTLARSDGIASRGVPPPCLNAWGDGRAADTSSSAATTIPVVGAAAAALATLRFEPILAKSVAAEVIISDAAVTYDMSVPPN